MNKLDKEKLAAGKICLSDLLVADYDEGADVLYITFMKPEVSKDIETDDLVIQKTLDNKLYGITIVDFKKRVGY